MYMYGVCKKKLTSTTIMAPLNHSYTLLLVLLLYGRAIHFICMSFMNYKPVFHRESFSKQRNIHIPLESEVLIGHLSTMHPSGFHRLFRCFMGQPQYVCQLVTYFLYLPFLDTGQVAYQWQSLK